MSGRNSVEVVTTSSYLFRNACLVDGSGNPPYAADVAVAGGRIAAVGPNLALSSELVVDASGLVICPGFIDIHGHSDMTLLRHPLLESKAFQGITTEVVGNCGLGLYPVKAGSEPELDNYLRLHDYLLPDEGITWSSLAEYAERIDKDGLGINVAPLIGHAPLRISAMGMESRPPVAAEMKRMEALLTTALQQGAWGMSTGLIYPPGCHATTDELIALARILARHDALYTSHIRCESEDITSALDEAVTIGARSGVRVQISHLKAMGEKNRGRAGELLKRLFTAHSNGVDIGADQYPYNASATTLTAVLPRWACSGSIETMLKHLSDPTLREELQTQIGREIKRRGGAAGIMVTGCGSKQNRRLSGETIAGIANRWASSPEETIVRLILMEKGNVWAIFYSMAEQDVATILSDPRVAIGSDGHAMNAVEDATETTHPRSYGTFPRILGRYVREEKLLTLASAIHKMTALPANRLGFNDRGLVRPGLVADLVIFDPATVLDLATYAKPHRYATGIIHLLVNGGPVIWDKRLTGNRPGRVLRKVQNRNP